MVYNRGLGPPGMADGGSSPPNPGWTTRAAARGEGAAEPAYKFPGLTIQPPHGSSIIGLDGPDHSQAVQARGQGMATQPYGVKPPPDRYAAPRPPQMIHQPQQPDPEIEVAKGGKIKPVDRMPHPSAPPVHGALHGFTGGRTDNTPINVQAGSYVIPADVVSNMPGAEGNTAAGFATLERWLKSMGDPPPYPQQKDAVPIIAAKGEFVIHPSHVKKIGGGDIKKGHDILDHLVKDIRAKAVKTMSKLPGPKR